ncbi:cytochrome P450 [Nocardia sp. 348MFTsu5.1]|uniref:cytochrome P450 n=1 Tax=Nocardia sp. 348MFTsu5.1 TaxID=1172185 RepID=UPI000365DE90|nr:cytochrome P450 [Nocardia sp. 348MFTsu5.1]
MDKLSPTWFAETMGFLTGYLDPNNPQPDVQKKFAESGIIQPQDGLFMVGSREGITQVCGRDAAFSSEEAIRIGNIRPQIPMHLDPPEHAKYRKLLDHLFSPKQMTGVEDEIVNRANSLIDAFQDRGECNFTNEFAEPYPGMIFLDLMGLPQSDRLTLQSMVDAIFHPGEGVTTDIDEIARIQNEGGQRVYDYFEQVIADRRKKPSDDVVSGFLEVEVDDRPLTTEEMLDMCFTLLVGGLDTVKATLTAFMAFLGRNPSYRDQLVADPTTIPQATEEMLRWETPTTLFIRRSTANQEVLGCPVKEGQMVILNNAAANLDPDVFPDPMTVDFSRKPNRHIAFGAGVHRCLGSHLARRELNVAMQEWHRRIPNWSLKPGTNLSSMLPIRNIDNLELIW